MQTKCGSVEHCYVTGGHLSRMDDSGGQADIPHEPHPVMRVAQAHGSLQRGFRVVPGTHRCRGGNASPTRFVA